MRLTTEAKYLQQVQHGKWIWVYDNLNYHQIVRHERLVAHTIYVRLAEGPCSTDKHSMLNMTSRLAIRLENIPDWDVDWLDNKPQLPRSKLNHTHFLPSEDDARSLEQYAMLYMMEFLVENFKSL